MTHPLDEPQWITINDLSKRLGGRSRASIYRDAKEGRLPRPIKLGSAVLFKISEVEKMLEEARVSDDWGEGYT